MNRWKREEGPSPQTAVTLTAPPHPEMDSITMFTCSVCVKDARKTVNEIVFERTPTFQSGSDAVKKRRNVEKCPVRNGYVARASDFCERSVRIQYSELRKDQAYKRGICAT